MCVGQRQRIVEGVAAQVFECAFERRPVDGVAVFRGFGHEMDRIGRAPLRRRSSAAPVGECAVGELIAAQPRQDALDIAVDVLQHLFVALGYGV